MARVLRVKANNNVIPSPSGLHIPYIHDDLIDYLDQAYPDSIERAKQDGLDRCLGQREVIEHLFSLLKDQTKK